MGHLLQFAQIHHTLISAHNSETSSKQFNQIRYCQYFSSVQFNSILTEFNEFERSIKGAATVL